MTAFNRHLLVASSILWVTALAAGETLRVQVLDAKTGAPVQAAVSALGTQPRLDSARTNEQGVAVVEVPSLEKLYAIVRSSTHGERCLSEDDTKEGIVVVRLEPSLRVLGVVRDPKGNPLREATVKLVYREDPKCRVQFPQPDVTTNERGEFVLRNVDVTRDATIVVRHDLYAERAILRGEISAAPSGPSANTKELEVTLAERN
jgi:hypothetical protein